MSEPNIIAGHGVGLVREGEAVAQEQEIGQWYTEGTLAYVLMQDGYRKGKPLLVNRFSVSVSKDRTVRAEEAVALAAKIADALNGETAQAWTAVEDGLPLDYESVWAAFPEGGCDMVFHSETGWHRQFHGEVLRVPPTHWINLPKHPDPKP